MKKIHCRIFLLAAIFFFSRYREDNLCAQTTNKLQDSLLSFLDKSQHDTEKINILIKLSIIQPCGESTLKQIYAQEAFDLSKKIEWRIGIIKTTQILGSYFYLCQKNYKTGIEYLTTCEELAYKIHDTTDLGNSIETIAKCYDALGQHNNAITYLNKALQFSNTPALKMGVLGDMGVIYNGIGDYREALICYNKALAILDNDILSHSKAESADTITRGGLILNIGDIYLSMSQADKALENYKSGYKIGEDCRNDLLKFYSTMGIGKAFFFKKNYPEATKNLLVALADSRRLHQALYEAGILNQLANTYLATGDIARATEYAEASQKLAEANGYNEQLPKTYTTLGKLLTLKDNHRQAIDYLQRAQSMSYQSRALDDEKNAWEALSTTYDKMRQPALALDAYRHFIALRDSLYNIDKANELVRIDLQATFGRKQLADSLKQAGQYEIKMQKQTVLTYSGFVALLLVLLLSFFIYRNYNTQKKYNELLSKEKELNLELIKAQSTVLTDIAYTQAHNLRGPVATILGLVQIYNFDDATDPDNKEIIEGISAVTERLDKTITEVINKENSVYSKEVSGRKVG